MQKTFRCLVAAAAVAFTPPPAHSAEESASLVVRNGKVLTVDHRFSVAEAVAVRDGRFPTREELDKMLSDRPVVFDWSYAGINQVQVLNTAAMGEARITRDTPDPAGGRIVRDGQGNPTGMIRNARSL